jgi:hypothetical protein
MKAPFQMDESKSHGRRCSCYPPCRRRRSRRNSNDIGQSNISAYTNGLMGYRLPNIDSIGQQGVPSTDHYGE